MRPLLCLESKLLLVVGLLLGVPAVIWIPPLTAYDGPTHYLRALQVSEGHFRAERYSERAVGGLLPASHCDFLNTMLWNYYWKPGANFANRAHWEALSGEFTRVSGVRKVEFTNTAIYSPVNYAFQAAGMRLASALSAEPLLANWMGCLFNLFGYLLVVVLALESAPRFRTGILLFASCPLLVVQAASLSADGINFALPLLLVAWTWRLREPENVGSAWELPGLLAVGLLVTLLKPILFMILPCLALVPRGRFGGSRRAKVAVLGFYALVVAGVWTAWNGPYAGIDIAGWFDRSRPPFALQEEWFLANPFRFVPPFLRFVTTEMTGQWPHLYGDPGEFTLPWSYALNRTLSVVFLGCFLGCASWTGKPHRDWAFGLLGVSFLLVVVTALVLWVGFATPAMTTVPNLVGRYLSVPAFLLGLAWAEFFHEGLPRLRTNLFWAALTANVAGLTAIILPVVMRSW